ncbi:MAG: hypothetical protein A2788_00655 [Candidatus Abawacabacteria bacterium RIFCSPHIGHO2_01_FULL_46_8]|uniref:Leucine-binding protein domain-containing protein n=1 Tax=Candidatus Abawacabacteria bacterium RIFCSPHIGHO2_01_FULL_46_8 TaxID=1817815 RepID=A0A1F4XK00_9BACT|nr:MAG: hypothetical protein A2788_00655 [Candidatus Abawacabacteria bacterium RIFCSPHIGHO2_01_FULL_46_8]
MKRFSTIFSLILLAFILSACASLTTDTGTAKPKIGVILPLTGKAAEYGQSAREGIEFARQKLKAAGKEFQLIWEDDQLDPKQSVTAYHKLTKVDGVKIIIGPIGSSNVLALAPLADEQKILILSPAVGANEATAGHPYVYRFWPSKESQMLGLITWLGQQGWQNIFAITAQNDSTLSALEVLERRFGKVANRFVPPDAKDFRTILIEAKQAKTDAIFLNLFIGQFASALKNYQELGLTIPVFASIIFDNQAEIAASKDLIAEMVFASTAIYTAEFAQELNKTSGAEPGIATASGYDAMMAVAKIATAADPKAALDNIGEINGAIGKYRLDENGDPTLESSPLKILRQGKVEHLKY